MDDLSHVKRKLLESGLLDGLDAATEPEAAAIQTTYEVWAVRLAPYLLRDPAMDVATALRSYRNDNQSAEGGAEAE